MSRVLSEGSEQGKDQKTAFFSLSYPFIFSLAHFSFARSLTAPTFLPIFAAPFREVSEWSKEHAWKVCMAQKVIVGSNPILSAASPRFRPGNGGFSFAEAV